MGCWRWWFMVWGGGLREDGVVHVADAGGVEEEGVCDPRYAVGYFVICHLN
eukprot:FN609028.1.p2 GENE.FN609028.1~~FN609028.1.p2  ORF type:complete len:51 (+),score=6.88 FN609028.1:67-219(+)